MLYQNYVKRMLDVLLAFWGILLCLPVYVGIAVLVWINLGRPVFFRQLRPGLQGKLFCICKYRTMTETKDAEGGLLPDEKRLTGFGNFLRATSLDELPELWNILKGDMSFVGPRPLLPEYLKWYSEEQRRRHEVRPGLTGWAQIHGRNQISWEEKFRYDLEYVEQISWRMDIRIMKRTVKKVFQREGIHSVNAATMESFEGIRARGEHKEIEKEEKGSDIGWSGKS